MKISTSTFCFGVRAFGSAIPKELLRQCLFRCTNLRFGNPRLQDFPLELNLSEQIYSARAFKRKHSLLAIFLFRAGFSSSASIASRLCRKFSTDSSDKSKDYSVFAIGASIRSSLFHIYKSR